MVRVRHTLAKLISPEKARLMYRAYDIIGDIIVTKIPKELDTCEQEVGEALHKTHPMVKRVFRIVGETRRVERNRRVKLIWPIPSSESGTSSENLARTVYSEHGCRFVVDVEKVFFTPRLSYERMRIAKQVKPGEIIASVFGGVGTYAIIIAKVCAGVQKVYTVDVNPIAHSLAEENIIINSCLGKVVPILGDARTVCETQLGGLCNRVIMPLPEYASSFLDSAIAALRKESDSTLNFYAEVSGKGIESEALKVIDATRRKVLGCGAKSCEVGTWRVVREVGPRKYHVAVDLRITR